MKNRDKWRRSVTWQEKNGQSLEWPSQKIPQWPVNVKNRWNVIKTGATTCSLQWLKFCFIFNLKIVFCPYYAACGVLVHCGGGGGLVAKLCLTLCDPMDCSPPGSSVHGILQARILEWVAMPSSRGSFPIQGWNPGLSCFLHWQVGSLPLAPPGKPVKPHSIKLL